MRLLRWEPRIVSLALQPSLGNLTSLTSLCVAEAALAAVWRLSPLQAPPGERPEKKREIPVSLASLTNLVVMCVPLTGLHARAHPVCSDLSSNTLNGTVPESLGGLTNLVELCVRRSIQRCRATKLHAAAFCFATV